MKRQIPNQNAVSNKSTGRIGFILLSTFIAVSYLFTPYNSQHAETLNGRVNNSQMSPKILDERNVKAFPELFGLPELLNSHAIPIEEARRSVREASQKCSDCSPFYDIREALPVEALTQVTGVWTIYTSRSNCAIYSVNDGPDYSWEQSMVHDCHDLHIWSCQRGGKSNKFSKFILYDKPCPRSFDSNISLPCRATLWGYGELDIMKLKLEAKYWQAWEHQLSSILPMQLILDFHSSSQQETAQSLNEERLRVNTIFLRLEELGYLVAKVSQTSERTIVTLIFIQKAHSKDTVLYDQPGDCPDELSIC
jgi:hypothetical protein